MGTKPAILTRLINQDRKLMEIKNTFLPGLLLAGSLLMWSCGDDDEFTLGEIPAPANVEVIFQIADDNSGVLTATPSAQGAASFEIFFGDVTDEEPTNIKPGESASHQYGEGDFVMRVIAVGIDGQRTEFTRDVVIRFSAPENLVVDLQVINRKVVVTPTADGATLFEVFFGDVENEEPTQVMPGNSAEHIYASIGEFRIMVLAFGTGAAFTEYVDTVAISESIELPVDFEDNTLRFNFVDFGNAATSVVDNPSPTGLNISSKVAKTIKQSGAETFAGTTLELGTPIDFNAFKTFKLNVLSPKSGITVKLKVENAADGSISAEVDVVNTVVDAWETLLFDFSAIDVSQEYQKVVVFFDFGNVGDGAEYFFDDIALTNEGGEVLRLPLDFESSTLTYTFTDFNGTTTTVVSNPVSMGVNTSATVVQSNKGAGADTFAGTILQLDNPIDFSTMKMIRMKVYSPKSGITVKFKVENATDETISAEVDAMTTVANDWEELTYDFSAIDTAQDYQKIIVFFDFGNVGDGTDYFFDDIQQSN